MGWENVEFYGRIFFFGFTLMRKLRRKSNDWRSQTLDVNHVIGDHNTDDLATQLTLEPPHDKTDIMTFAPSKDSDPPSLIRV